MKVELKIERERKEASFGTDYRTQNQDKMP